MVLKEKVEFLLSKLNLFIYEGSHVQYRQTDTVWKHSLTIRMDW